MEMAPPCVPGHEAPHAIQGELASLIQTALPAISAKTPNPLEVQAGRAHLQAAVGTPNAKYVVSSGRLACAPWIAQQCSREDSQNRLLRVGATQSDLEHYVELTLAAVIDPIKAVTAFHT
jgi:hypothetical protein